MSNVICVGSAPFRRLKDSLGGNNMGRLKYFVILLSILGGVMVNTANATLIDRGSITYDDVNQMEWLDLSLTDDMQPGIALSRYSADGWTIATKDQYQTMFDSFFTGFIDDGAWSQTVATDTTLYSQIQEFNNLFGLTVESTAGRTSYGFYMEGSIVRLGGVHDGLTSGTLFRNHGGNWTNASDTSLAGVFLVRAAVPETATLALLALGLLGLGFNRRKA